MSIKILESKQIADMESVPIIHNATTDLHGRIRVAFFEFRPEENHSDTITLVRLIKLPAGCLRILSLYCYYNSWGGSKKMNIGYMPFVNIDGEEVLEDYSAIASNINIASSGEKIFHPATLLKTRKGVTVSSYIFNGAVNSGNILYGYVSYVMD